MKLLRLRSGAANRFASLQAFANFWAHDAPSLTCCQFASDEDVRNDPDAFNCETCPVADALHALAEDTDNVRAWRLYHQVATRFNADTQAGGVVLARLTADLELEDFQDVVGRLSVLYDTLSPPPEPKS